MKEKRFDPYQKSRWLYIVEAAVEYFIHICVTTTFLTALLNEMEVSSALQGVVSNIASLACGVQLIAVFWVKKTYPCKRWVCWLNLISQLFFGFLYCIPLTPFSKGIKIGAFVLLLAVAYVFEHYLTPSRINWHMSLVDDNRRGVFTANKEIISLIGGMAFSQGAGILLDYFKAKGDMETCFILFAVTITVLSVWHLVIMLMIREPEPQRKISTKSFREVWHVVLDNRELRRVVIFDVLFVISTVSIHFYSVYLTRTFGMTYTYITAIAVIHAAFRAVVSRFLGRLADRRSWAYMLRICMLVLAVGYVIFAVCSPKTVIYLYPVFSLCYAFSLGGSNSGRTNLCLDYAAQEDRRYVLGIKFAISGIFGFVATLLASALVEAVEQNGNQFFGISVYPQQILFVISAVMLTGLAFFFLPKLKTPARVLEMDANTKRDEKNCK